MAYGVVPSPRAFLVSIFRYFAFITYTPFDYQNEFQSSACSLEMKLILKAGENLKLRNEIIYTTILKYIKPLIVTSFLFIESMIVYPTCTCICNQGPYFCSTSVSSGRQYAVGKLVLLYCYQR